MILTALTILFAACLYFGGFYLTIRLLIKCVGYPPSKDEGCLTGTFIFVFWLFILPFCVIIQVFDLAVKHEKKT